MGTLVLSFTPTAHGATAQDSGLTTPSPTTIDGGYEDNIARPPGAPRGTPDADTGPLVPDSQAMPTSEQPDPVDVLWWPTVSTDADGPCLSWEREVFDGAANSRRAAEADERALDLTLEYSVCQDAPVDEVSPEEQLTSAVTSAYDATRVPQMQPYVAPGWAITGMPAYLEAGPESATRATPSLDLEVATVTLDIAADIVVDWGDGTVTGPHDNTGGPWPEGAINHVYQDKNASQRITVSQTWRGTWSAASEDDAFNGLGGELPDLPVTRVLDLPVTEVQAVRQR